MRTQDAICAFGVAVLAVVTEGFAAGADEARIRVHDGSAAVAGKTVVARTIGEPSEPSVGVAPLAVSILPGAGAPGDGWSIYGLRVNMLAGRHRDIAGADIGVLGNIVVEDFDGVQLAGIWNSIGRSDGAVQAAGIVNRCDRDFAGLQAAGVVNAVDGVCEGVQLGLVNRAAVLSGLQMGFYNVIDRGSGLQIGVVNSSRSFEGLQIGAVNIIGDSTMPFFPVVNFAF